MPQLITYKNTNHLHHYQISSCKRHKSVHYKILFLSFIFSKKTAIHRSPKGGQDIKKKKINCEATR